MNQSTAGLQPAIAAVKTCIQASQFSQAELQAQSLLEQNTTSAEKTEALYLLAVAQRYQEKFDAAIASQTKLIEFAPHYARAYQERGHTLMSINQLADAQRAYEKAVNHNPTLLASWKALLNLYELHNKHLNRTVDKHSQRAKEQLEYLLTLPQELLTVQSYIHENKLFEADQLCRHFMRQHKQHIEGMRTLAQIGEKLGILPDAEFLLETALMLAPENPNVRFDYANLLLKMQKFEKAHQQTTKLLEISPDNLSFLSLHANATSGIGQYTQAIEYYNKVIQASPGQNMLMLMRGHAEKTAGLLQDAITSYQAAYKSKPDYGDAYWSLANTKSYQFSAAELNNMRTQIDSDSTNLDDQIHMCFALGKCLEDQQEYAESFKFYEQGNALKQAAVKHRPEYLKIRATAQVEVCNEAFFANRTHTGHQAPDPIFIVGLPRAGSTLIEQILASHSLVDGTMELPNIISLAQRLRRGQQQNNQPNYPQLLEHLDYSYFQRFGEQFIEETKIYRQGAPFFIDKNPNNFFHIGLIKLILPKAKIIDARRHPMACCFSGFKQLFGQGQEFTYGLKEIGNYYREYVELMQHWDKVLPDFVLRVQHEELIDDLEGQVKRILDFCGLEFEQACLEYYKNERAVRTPSSEQVRQPIFKTSLETWTHYEPWLGPLKDALGADVRKTFGIV